MRHQAGSPHFPPASAVAVPRRSSLLTRGVPSSSSTFTSMFCFYWFSSLPLLLSLLLFLMPQPAHLRPQEGNSAEGASPKQQTPVGGGTMNNVTLDVANVTLELSPKPPPLPSMQGPLPSEAAAPQLGAQHDVARIPLEASKNKSESSPKSSIQSKSKDSAAPFTTSTEKEHSVEATVKPAEAKPSPVAAETTAIPWPAVEHAVVGIPIPPVGSTMRAPPTEPSEPLAETVRLQQPSESVATMNNTTPSSIHTPPVEGFSGSVTTMIPPPHPTMMASESTKTTTKRMASPSLVEIPTTTEMDVKTAPPPSPPPSSTEHFTVSGAPAVAPVQQGAKEVPESTASEQNHSSVPPPKSETSIHEESTESTMPDFGSSSVSTKHALSISSNASDASERTPVSAVRPSISEEQQTIVVGQAGQDGQDGSTRIVPAGKIASSSTQTPAASSRVQEAQQNAEGGPPAQTVRKSAELSPQNVSPDNPEATKPPESQPSQTPTAPKALVEEKSNNTESPASITHALPNAASTPEAEPTPVERLAPPESSPSPQATTQIPTTTSASPAADVPVNATAPSPVATSAENLEASGHPAPESLYSVEDAPKPQATDATASSGETSSPTVRVHPEFSEEEASTLTPQEGGGGPVSVEQKSLPASVEHAEHHPSSDEEVKQPSPPPTSVSNISNNVVEPSQTIRVVEPLAAEPTTEASTEISETPAAVSDTSGPSAEKSSVLTGAPPIKHHDEPTGMNRTTEGASDVREGDSREATETPSQKSSSAEVPGSLEVTGPPSLSTAASSPTTIHVFAPSDEASSVERVSGETSGEVATTHITPSPGGGPGAPVASNEVSQPSSSSTEAQKQPSQAAPSPLVPVTAKPAFSSWPSGRSSTPAGSLSSPADGATNVTKTTTEAPSGFASGESPPTERAVFSHDASPEKLPDPTKPADPSLLPLILDHPEYRELSNTVSSTASSPAPATTTQKQPSSTIMSLTEGGEPTTAPTLPTLSPAPEGLQMPTTSSPLPAPSPPLATTAQPATTGDGGHPGKAGEGSTTTEKPPPESAAETEAPSAATNNATTTTMAATEEEGQTVSVLPQQNTAPNPPPPGRAPPPPIPPTGVPPVAVTGPPPSAAGRILPLSSVAAGVPPIVVNKAVVPSPNPAAANLTVANEALLENVGTNTTGILEAITNAIDWSKVVFQNITLVLPESASSAIHSFIERLLSRQLSVEPPVLQPLPTPAPLIQQQQMQQQTPAEAASNQPSTSADQQKTNNETTSPISTTTTVNPPPLGTTIIQTPSFRDSQQQQRQNQNQNQQYPSPVHYGPGAYVPVQQKPLAYFSDSGTTGQQQQYQQPGGTATNTFVAPPTSPPRQSMVGVEELNSWLKTGRPIKLLDASYEPETAPTDYVRFYDQYWAKWDRLIEDKKGRQYDRSHIPGAIPFNLNIATYPTWNEQQALYPADQFEQYIQRLGVDQDDLLVVYARGPMGGMLHASRAWFLFRIYGHENVVVLNGGFDAWKKADLPSNDQQPSVGDVGNWTANITADLMVTFDQLTTVEQDGYCVLSRLYWYNFLDARPRTDYFGVTTLQNVVVQSHPTLRSQRGNWIPGTKSFPADELITTDGTLLPPTEIMRRLQTVNFARANPTIVAGNSPDEASLVLLALAQVQETRARLYNGGLEEIRRRAPQWICC